MSVRNALNGVLLGILIVVMIFGIGNYIGKIQAIPLDERIETLNAINRLFDYKFGNYLVKNDYINNAVLKQALRAELFNLPTNIYMDLMRNIEKDEALASSNGYFINCLSGYLTLLNMAPGTTVERLKLEGAEPKTSDKFYVASPRTKIRWELNFTGSPYAVTITLMRVLPNKTTKDIAIIKTSELKGEAMISYGADELQIKVMYLMSKNSKLSWKIVAAEAY